nr:TIGR03773 family transporter-associated surface protein [Motilibacter aurantiacus]
MSAGLQSAASAAEDAPLLLHRGHIDLFDVTYDAEARNLDLRVKDDTKLYAETAVLREPEDVVIPVDPAITTTTVPVDPDYGFLGAAGQPIYVLQQNGRNADGIRQPWPGWGAETVPGGLLQDDFVVLDVDVEGPGKLFAYSSGAGAPRVYVDGNFDWPDDIETNVGSHVHTNWAFTSQGTYTLRVRAKATTVDGRALVSPTSTYTFVVGTPAEQPPPPPTTLSIAGAGVTYAPGDQVALEALQQPATELTEYMWESRRPGAADFSSVLLSGSGTYGFPARLADDGTQYRVSLLDRHRDVVAVSAPVNVRVREPGSGQVPAGDACAQDGVEVMTEGHADLALRLRDDGELVAQVKDGRAVPAVWRGPSQVAFRLDAAARGTVSPRASLSFLGRPGDPVWTIGQTQQAGVPWLGWSTDDVTLTDAVGDEIGWRMDRARVTGPGDVYLFQSDAFGSVLPLLGTGAGWPATTTISRATHSHGTWAFTAPGRYSVPFTYTATSYGRETSTSATLTFLVGPCASATPSPQPGPGASTPPPPPAPAVAGSPPAPPSPAPAVTPPPVTVQDREPRPAVLARARLTGTPVVGSRLTCRPAFSGGTVRSYRWLRDGRAVQGRSSARRLVAADAGHRIRCRVVVANAAGTASSLSPTRTVKPRPERARTRVG